MRSSRTRSGFDERKASTASAAVVAEDRVEALGAQHDADHLGERGVVVDHQDATVHVRTFPRTLLARRSAAQSRTSVVEQAATRMNARPTCPVGGPVARAPDVPAWEHDAPRAGTRRARRDRRAELAGTRLAGGTGAGGGQQPPQYGDRQPQYGQPPQYGQQPQLAAAAVRLAAAARPARSPAGRRRRSPASSPCARSTFGTLLGAPFQALRRNPRITVGAALLLQGIPSIVVSVLIAGGVALLLGRTASTPATPAISAPSAPAPSAASIVLGVLSLVISRDLRRPPAGRHRRRGRPRDARREADVPRALAAWSRAAIGALIGWTLPLRARLDRRRRPGRRVVVAPVDRSAARPGPSARSRCGIVGGARPHRARHLDQHEAGHGAERDRAGAAARSAQPSRARGG